MVKKLMIIVVLLFVIIFVSKGLNFYIKNRESIDYLFAGQRFEYKIFTSPSNKNKFTLLLHLVGWPEHESNIYIIDGVYHEKKIPTGNYIKFPDSTGVYVVWENDKDCTIYSDFEPERSNLSSQNYTINIKKDRNKIDSLWEKGMVIRYSVKPKIPSN